MIRDSSVTYKPATRWADAMKELLELIDQTIGYPVDESFADWDSMENMYIVIACEKKWDIQFPTDKFKQTNARDLWAAIENLIAAKRSAAAPRIKAIVVDCDNTLWRGVIGEESVTVDGPHKTLQEQLVQAEADGYLICIASKNDVQSVSDVFDNHPEMVLKREHITLWEVSWGAKHDGIRRMLEQLQIGEDSILFLDDNPMERDLIRVNLPTAHVPDSCFDIARFLTYKSAEGSLTDKYRNALSFRQVAGSNHWLIDRDDAFLQSLNMEGTIWIDNLAHAVRVAELSEKTNQFNMLLARTPIGEIKRRMESDVSTMVFSASLKDRYGDHGVVAMMIVHHDGIGSSGQPHNVWHVTDFCVSCRALGRGFERAFYQRAIACLGNDRVDCEFVPGPKNRALCENFIRNLPTLPPVPVKWLIP